LLSSCARAQKRPLTHTHTNKQCFLKCFEALGDTKERSEEYFRLYAQMHYVVQRNTKEECLEQLLPRHGLPARWAEADEDAPPPQGDDDATDTEYIGADVAWAAEQEAVSKVNDRVLEAMREQIHTLEAETAALEAHSQQLDAEIAAAEASVQAAVEPFRRLRAVALAAQQQQQQQH